MPVFRCISGFAVATPDGPRVVPGGALVADGDPILKTHRTHFEAVEDYTTRISEIAVSAKAEPVRAVETATAGPAERRSVSVPPAPSVSAPAAPVRPSTPSKGGAA